MITLNSCYTFYKHIYPSKEDCTSFIDTLHLLEQTMLYLARFGGQVYATISMLLGCKYIYIYIKMFIPELRSFALWLWCISLIAFNRSPADNRYHSQGDSYTVTMILHGNCMGIAWELHGTRLYPRTSE